MKKQRLGVVLFLALFFLLPLNVFAQVEDERIEKFKIDIIINRDSSIDVAETITYNFGDKERHGIFRFIPKTYFKDDLKYRTVISDYSVTDEKSNSYNVEFTSLGDKFQAKIGDPNIYISGVKTYVIKYKVRGAIGYFDDRDELYWNLTGNEWNVPIENIESTIKIDNFNLHNTLYFSCYSGKYGDTNDCSSSAKTALLDNQVKLESVRKFEQGEGITIALGFPKGLVFEPSWVQKNITLIISLGIDGLLIILLAYMVGRFWFIWSKEGKDPKGRGVIVAEYDVPDNLTPLEVSAIVHQRMRVGDISSEIIFLAVNGYLKIKHEPKKVLGIQFESGFSLIRTDKKFVGSYHDEMLLRRIFGGENNFGKEIHLKDLENNFYKSLDDIKEEVAKAVFEKGYYTKNNSEILKSRFFKNIGFSSVVAIFSLFFFIYLIALGLLHFSVAIIVAQFIWIPLVILGVAYYIMPKKTEKGVEAKEKIDGLEKYLRIAEKNRLEFHNAPEKKPEIFEKLLPFAMVLGVAEIWAKEFADIYKTPPDWYVGNSNFANANFASAFTSEIDTFARSSSSSFTSHPSSSGSGFSGSSGGGFSGGGGGGGGGGSW